jgi:outer membrane immunogenic protein
MWVLGFETDIQASGEKGSSRFGAPYSDCEGGSCNLFGTIHSEIKWFGTARARAGWLVTPTTLVYATGGVAYGEVAAHGSIIDTGCFPTSCTWSFGGSSVNVGYVVGAGFEFFPATLPNFSIKAEYLYMDLGSLSGSGFDSDFGGTYSWSANFTDHIVRMGLNYHLN